MTEELLIELIAKYSADVILIIGYIFTGVKTAKAIINNKDTVNLKNEVIKMKDMNQQLLQDNLELKKQQAELIKKIDNCNIQAK